MEKNTEIMDTLLEKDCYIIDYLPETVPADSGGQFFDVEYYLLNSSWHMIIKNKFVGVILKMMCYYHAAVLWGGWIDRPRPGLIDEAVSEIMENHSGTLNCLFMEENALLVFDWDCLNLSIYNPHEKMRHILAQIAFSEGLFWRVSET